MAAFDPGDDAWINAATNLAAGAALPDRWNAVTPADEVTTEEKIDRARVEQLAETALPLIFKDRFAGDPGDLDVATVTTSAGRRVRIAALLTTAPWGGPQQKRRLGPSRWSEAPRSLPKGGWSTTSPYCAADV